MPYTLNPSEKESFRCAGYDSSSSDEGYREATPAFSIAGPGSDSDGDCDMGGTPWRSRCSAPPAQRQRSVAVPNPPWTETQAVRELQHKLQASDAHFHADCTDGADWQHVATTFIHIFIYIHPHCGLTHFLVDYRPKPSAFEHHVWLEPSLTGRALSVIELHFLSIGARFRWRSVISLVCAYCVRQSDSVCMQTSCQEPSSVCAYCVTCQTVCACRLAGGNRLWCVRTASGSQTVCACRLAVSRAT